MGAGSDRAGDVKPLAVDLYCGLGGWTQGLLAAGYDVIGFDIEIHEYGEHRYPAQLVVQDVLTLDGRQLKDADLIVASPPCQEYSYMAMPWKRAKQIAAALRGKDEFPEGYTGSRTTTELNALFGACFRIQREASEAAGRHIPMVVENVRGAIPWVGRSRWNYGSFHLWGDVPALMPMAQAFKSSGMNWSDRTKHGQDFTRIAGEQAIKNTGGSWFNIAHNTASGKGSNPDGRKTTGHANKRDGYSHTRHLTNQAESDAAKCGGHWFNGKSPSNMRKYASKSTKRRMASAMIAKIPLALAHHIAITYKPKGANHSRSGVVDMLEAVR